VQRGGKRCPKSNEPGIGSVGCRIMMSANGVVRDVKDTSGGSDGVRQPRDQLPQHGRLRAGARDV